MASSRDESPTHASEQTPLLSRTDSPHDYDEANGHVATHEPAKRRRRWPIIVALSGLVIAVILAIVFGFVMPSAVEEYAKEAISFEADKIAVDSFTDSGVRVHVQGTVWMDATKVKKGSVRSWGKWATGWAKTIEAGKADMKVFLPAYDDLLLGSAYTPAFKLDIRDGHHNPLDMIVECEPGEPTAFRRLAQDFMDHKEQDLLVKAVVELPIKAGGFNIGVQKNTQMVTIPRKKGSKMPEPKLNKLKVLQHGPKGKPDGIEAWASLTVDNPSPIELTVPPVTMDVLLADCHSGYDLFATTTSDEIRIVPKQELNVSATGFMSKLPSSLTSACPGSNRSPLDDFIQKYLKGDEPTVYIRGGKQSDKTPSWIGNLLHDTILPVPLPPKPPFDQSIKNFSLTGVHFSLPKTDQERPVLSATVNVLVGLPEGIDLDVDVHRIRSDGAIYYEGQAMSKLDLSEWQQATSKKVDGDLLVSSKIIDAPLDIVNEDVFAKVVHKMVFEKKGVPLELRATVDIDATTALGTFVVSGIPSKGKIFIDPPKTDGFKHEVKEISVEHTTPESLTMKARVNVNNPTDYRSSMPYVNVSLYVNETRMGYAWASAEIKPGDNEIISYVRWDKSKIGAEFMSQYISGYNVSLTIAQFDGSIPGLPNLGMNVTVPMPHMFGKFLKDTTVSWSRPC